MNATAFSGIRTIPRPSKDQDAFSHATGNPICLETVSFFRCLFSDGFFLRIPIDCPLPLVPGRDKLLGIYSILYTTFLLPIHRRYFCLPDKLHMVPVLLVSFAVFGTSTCSTFLCSCTARMTPCMAYFLSLSRVHSILTIHEPDPKSTKSALL